MKKIVLTGPESSGKTILAAQLAGHFGTVWVPEFARQYLDGIDRPYTAADLRAIALGQVALEDEMTAFASNGLLFLDTSLEVVKVWLEFRFGYCHHDTLDLLHERLPDFYLLCHPDLPWAADPQRENPDDRDVLLDIYRRELTSLGVAFGEVAGEGAGRFENALNVLNCFFKN